MTVEIDAAGPGVETDRSTLFEATVGGDAVYVYGVSRTTEYDVLGFWDASDTVEVSWITFGSDSTTTVEVAVTLADATPITSAVIYPKHLEISYTIAAGVLTIAMPQHVKARVEVNGDPANVLFVHHDNLKGAIPAGYVTYNGSQTSVADDACLYFPAGRWVLPAAAGGAVTAANPVLFPLGDNSTIYLDYGAVVVGNIDVRSKQGWTIMGPGVLHGGWTTNEDVDALPTFDAQYLCAMIYGYTPGPEWTGCTVRDITVVKSPFYSVDAGNIFRDVKVYCPWTDNSDGIKPLGDLADSSTYYVEDCSIWCGDDALDLHEWRRNGVISNNLLSTSGGAIFLFSYWPYGDYGFTTTIEDNYVRPVCDYYNVNDTEGGAVIQCWVDGSKSNTAYGRFNVTIDGLYVEGDTINCVLFWIGNRVYPWGTTSDSFGVVSNWAISNVYVESVPAEPSKLRGLSAEQTPHDITFENIWIGDNQLSHRNWSTYVESDDYSYGISVEGKTLVTAVDICNTALSHLGAAAKVTSISPVDGSAEARHCARFYPISRDAILALHDWSFARTRAALVSVTIDNDAWDYAYTIPADMLKAIAVMHEDSTDDYTVALALPDGTTATPMGASNQVIPQSYVIEQNTSDVLVIMTDMEDAWLRYTKYVTDTNQFPPLFVMAVTYHLASLLAGVLIKGKDGAAENKRCTQLAMAYLSQARVVDSMQRQVNTSRSPSWIAAR